MQPTLRDHISGIFSAYAWLVTNAVAFYLSLPIMALLGFFVFMSLAWIVMFVLNIFAKIAWWVNHIFNWFF